MSETPVYREWDTPSKTLPPILIRYGDKSWQTQIKIGDEWLPVSDVQVHLASDKNLNYVELKLYGHISFEKVEAPSEQLSL